MTPRLAAIVALVLGAVAVVAATLVGANADALEAIVHPPPLIRAALVGASAAIAVIRCRAVWPGSPAVVTMSRA